MQQHQPVISAEGYPANVPSFAGLAATKAGPWMRISGHPYVNFAVRAAAFSGTIIAEGSMDGKTSDGTILASVTVGGITPTTNDVQIVGFPYVRLNVTAYTSGAIDEAFVYGYGGR